jgi:hypothetical protein
VEKPQTPVFAGETAVIGSGRPLPRINWAGAESRLLRKQSAKPAGVNVVRIAPNLEYAITKAMPVPQQLGCAFLLACVACIGFALGCWAFWRFAER